MQESPAKAVARELYHKRAIPAWLTKEQIQTGHRLMLLSYPARELPYLDELNVPRANIISVEDNYSIYRDQLNSHWGVGLHYGKVVDYLEMLLHENKSLVDMNLDIEGPYLNNLDPAMTSVHLFCWRNPQTVVGTYSTVGYDYRMIWEGIKSLQFFILLAPRETLNLLNALTTRYEQAHYLDPVNLALRDLFWIRSNVEHALNASAVIGVISPSIFRKVILSGNQIWEYLIKVKHKPLKTQHLLDAAKQWVSLAEAEGVDRVLRKPAIGIEVNDLYHVIYRGQNQWSQMCYFVRFKETGTLLSAREWALGCFKLFMQKPLIYICKKGKEYSINNQPSGLMSTKLLELWHDNRIYKEFKPRNLEVKFFSPHIIGISQTIRELHAAEMLRPFSTNGSGVGAIGTEVTESEKEVLMATKESKVSTKQSKYFDSSKKLTEYGKSMVKSLVAQGLVVGDIMQRLPVEQLGEEQKKKLRHSLAAYVANAPGKRG